MKKIDNILSTEKRGGLMARKSYQWETPEEINQALAQRVKKNTQKKEHYPRNAQSKKWCQLRLYKTF